MADSETTTTRESVITWTEGHSGRRLDLCEGHSEDLTGGYQVYHGAHDVVQHWDWSEAPVPACARCAEGV